MVPTLRKLPDDVAGTNIDPAALASDLDEALKDGRQLLGSFSQGLGNLQPALAEVERGVASLRSALEAVDAVAQDVFHMARVAVADLMDARNALRSLVPATADGWTNPTRTTLLQATYDLQQNVTGPLDTVHSRVRTEINALLTGVDHTFKKVIDRAASAVDRVLLNLQDSVLDAMRNIEGEIQSTVDSIVDEIRSFLKPLRFVYLDAAPVIGPGTFETYLGLASGVAAIKGTAETRGRSWSSLSGSERDRWRDRIGWDEDRKPYASIYGDVEPKFTSSDDRTASVEATSEWLESGSPPSDVDVGGGTSGVLHDWGVRIDEARGSIETSPVGDPQENQVQLDELKLEVQATLGEEGSSPAFHADTIGMHIDRHGSYYVFGRNVTSNIVKKNPKADVDLLVNTSEPRFEGGLTVKQLDLEQVYVAEAGAAVGVGKTVLYVGIKFEGFASLGTGKVGVGGTVLAGRVNATSKILQHHFPDATSKISGLPAGDEGQEVFTGMYMQANADLPLETLIGMEFGCVLDVNVGARLGFWYFDDRTVQPTRLTFGLLVGGYAYGKVVCAVSARGELTLEFSVQGTLPQDGPMQGTAQVKGVTWMAGGLGSCSPGTWIDWSKRWWSDGWCLQGGARAQVTGTAPIPFDASRISVKPKVSADAEGPL